MSEFYTFPCGCRFPIVGPPPQEGALPLLDTQLKKPPFCSATWDLLATGKTKGIFQLESPLGKQWAKKAKPRHPEHLSGLCAVLRPGCMRAIDEEGVSMTEHYVRRINGEEPVTYFHPALEPILFRSCGIQIYQEDAMIIARVIAGFSPTLVDRLRKGIGKKIAEEISKLEVEFITGCERVGIVTTEFAKQLFEWIRTGQRYSFNHSHSVCYGLIGYSTAYVKAHFPVHFFATWLHHAHTDGNRMQEIRELVEDARLFNVPVETPDITRGEERFWTDGMRVGFGLADVRQVGSIRAGQLLAVVREAEQTAGKPIQEWSWLEVLAYLSNKLTAVVHSLIKTGGFRHWGMGRKHQLHEAKLVTQLSKGEKSWLAKYPHLEGGLRGALVDMLKPKSEGGGCQNDNRRQIVRGIIQLLDKPSEPLDDHPWWIAAQEELLLGVNVTCSKVDSCNQEHITCTVSDYLGGKSGIVLMGVEIREVNERIIRKGDNEGKSFCRLTVADSTGMFDDIICWPEVREEYASFLTPKNCVLLQGERSHKTGSFIVSRVFQL